MKPTTPTYSSDFLTALRRQLGEAVSTRQAVEMSGLFSAEERESLLKQQDKSIRILERRIDEWIKADKLHGVVR